MKGIKKIVAAALCGAAAIACAFGFAACTGCAFFRFFDIPLTSFTL